MALTREQQKQKTRQDILQAAIAVFSKWGYEGGSFREITAICGAKRALILYHYESKEVLWRDAVVEVEQRFSGAFRDIYQPNAASDDRARIEYVLNCFVQALINVPEYGMIFLREGVSDGPRMDWLAKHMMPSMTKLIKLSDKKMEQKVKKSIMRDILASTLIAFVTLGPMLERGHAMSARQSSAGLYPLSEKRKQEFIDHVLQMIFSET